jgi:hypothetical protein
VVQSTSPASEDSQRDFRVVQQFIDDFRDNIVWHGAAWRVPGALNMGEDIVLASQGGRGDISQT